VASGTVVIADPEGVATGVDGIFIIDADIAIGDGDGGLVVQRAETVLWIAADGTERTLLDEARFPADLGPARLWLHDVTLVEGGSKAVVVVGYGQEYPDIFEEIWLVDLESGTTESVYEMVAVESHITRVSAVPGTMVVSVSFEGGTYFEYLDTEGQTVVLNAPYDGGVPGGVADFPIAIDQGVLSPDGTTLAYLEIDRTQPREFEWMVELVIWDLVDGTEQWRVELTLGLGAFHDRLDFDGASVVLGRRDLETGSMLTPLRVESLESGTITDLGTPGTPSLIKRFGG
jgi:hypothetical protein